METFLICLAILISALAIALFVWWLFKPKRESVLFIRPHKTSLDLEAKAAEQNRRDDAAQRQQAAAKWAVEQNRRDREAQMLQASRIENQNQPSCDSGSSSSSSSSSSSD